MHVNARSINCRYDNRIKDSSKTSGILPGKNLVVAMVLYMVQMQISYTAKNPQVATSLLTTSQYQDAFAWLVAACCKLSILPTCCNLLTSYKLVKIRLVATCHLQTC